DAAPDAPGPHAPAQRQRAAGAPQPHRRAGRPGQERQALIRGAPMRQLIELAVSNVAAAAVLALVATVVGRVCRRPALVHALWLLVLLKLLTPPLVRVPVPWPTRPAQAQESAEVLPVPAPQQAAPE